jgi:hypothetical protein
MGRRGALRNPGRASHRAGDRRPLSAQQAISTYPDASRVGDKRGKRYNFGPIPELVRMEAHESSGQVLSDEDHHADGRAEILSLEQARVLAQVAGNFMKLLQGTDP